MDNLSLLYEKQNLPTNVLRIDLLNQIRIAESHGNQGRVEELAEFLNSSEREVLISEGILDGVKNVWSGVKNAASGTVQRYQDGRVAQQKKNFVAQLSKLYQPAVEMAKQIFPAVKGDQQFATVTNALAQFMSAVRNYEQTISPTPQNNTPAATPTPLPQNPPQQAPVQPQAATSQPQMPKNPPVRKKQRMVSGATP